MRVVANTALALTITSVAPDQSECDPDLIWTPAGSVFVPGFPSHIVVADLDGDSKLAVVTANSSTGTLALSA